MTCPTCGTQNRDDARFCARCGAALQGQAVGEQQAPTAAAPPDDAVSKVIPYRNTCALISYYLGVFALIPCLGVVLALAAIPLGIAGLNAVKKNPAAHGKVHAWVGIVLGALVLLGHLCFFVGLRLIAGR